MWSPALYQRAIRFAAEAHRGQQLPGSDLPYLVHLATVAMEVGRALTASPGRYDGDLAVACALLHDTLEDTGVTMEELHTEFGEAVAQGVAALTKNEAIEDKTERMADSLSRVLQQPPEIALVKLADRITNLQKPPHYWSPEIRRAYREEAALILERLGAVDDFLRRRLEEKIETYGQWC
jgi:(p)ppGpp synthase/HD superfamily hydrolase